MNWRSAIQQHPIIMRDLQKYAPSKQGIFKRRLAQMAWVLLLLILGFAFVIESASLITQQDFWSPFRSIYGVFAVACVITLMLQIIVLFTLIARASQAIVTDYPQRDLIALTGISARGYVWAKWWAVFYASGKEILLIGILRTFGALWVASIMSRTLYEETNDIAISLAFPPAVNLLLIPFIGLGFLVGVCVLVSGIAIFTSAISRSKMGAFIKALLLSVVILIVPALLIQMSRPVIETTRGIRSTTRDTLRPLAQYAYETWTSNGIHLALNVIDYRAVYEYREVRYALEYYHVRRVFAFVGSVIFTTAIYGGGFVLSLYGAELACRRMGMLPPQNQRRAKKRRLRLKPVVTTV